MISVVDVLHKSFYLPQGAAMNDEEVAYADFGIGIFGVDRWSLGNLALGMRAGSFYARGEEEAGFVIAVR